MTPSDVLSLILIAVVVADIVLMRVEMRRLRSVERKCVTQHSPHTIAIELTCDDVEFQRRIAQAMAAAKEFADLLAVVNAEKAKANL